MTSVRPGFTGSTESRRATWHTGSWARRSRCGGRDAAGLGRDLGIDLVQSSVAVFEDVVFVVELGEPFGQRQLMSVAPVNPDSEPFSS
ncbi:hypothetical protein [Streptomyces sp. NPDC004266]|uniref:hypothetical protein n=1 Tax=Streptomyces sp. NPDC004266 TaxID=3364693 RepID=UPI0036B8342B